jgi:hypothetical protein
VPEGAWRALAATVVVGHLGFVLFVVLGGLLAWRRRIWAWPHLAAVAWGAWIELSGAICPLTPLENRLRQLGGEAGYQGDFIGHYLLPLLYPDGLDRTAQLVLAAFVIGLNAAIYSRLLVRLRHPPAAPPA